MPWRLRRAPVTWQFASSPTRLPTRRMLARKSVSSIRSCVVAPGRRADGVASGGLSAGARSLPVAGRARCGVDTSACKDWENYTPALNCNHRPHGQRRWGGSGCTCEVRNVAAGRGPPSPHRLAPPQLRRDGGRRGPTHVGGVVVAFPFAARVLVAQLKVFTRSAKSA